MKKGPLFLANRSREGFSLLEVMAALFLLAVMVFMAAFSFLHISPKYKLKKTVWEINSRMNYARYKAIFRGAKVRIRFDSKSYAIEEYDQNQEKWSKGQKYFLEGVNIQANNKPIFHPRGTVSNLASIYVSNEWGKYRITVAISGRIKVVRL